VEEKRSVKFKGTIILLVISLIIGAVYLFYLLPAEKEKRLREELLSRFFRVDERQIEFLRIQNQNGIFNIVKDKNGWTVSSPLNLPTDKNTMKSLLQLITEGKIMKIITSDMKRASDFALDVPRAVLFIGYRGTIDELALGGMNPSKTGFYAFVKGINAIFLVDEEIAGIHSIDLYDLRSKSLFHFNPDIITEISIIRRDGEIVMRKKNEIWYVMYPLSGRASKDDIMDFLLGILNQRADEFYDNNIPEAQSYRDTIKLKLTSAKNESHMIDIHYWGTGMNEGSVAYQNGMNYSGRLPRDFWNFINRDASGFRYRNLFEFKEKNVQYIEVKKEYSRYELRREGTRWYAGQKTADVNKITGLIWFLKAWKASKLLGQTLDLSRNQPEYEVSIRDKNGNVLGTLSIYEKLPEESLGFSQKGEEQFLYYAISENLEDICAVSSLDIKKIPDREDLVQ